MHQSMRNTPMSTLKKMPFMGRSIGAAAGVQALALVAVLAAMTSPPALAQRVVGSFEETIEVETPLELDVRTGSGSIEVREGSTDRVEIVGRITVWGRNGRLSEDELDELVARLEADPPIELVGSTLRVGGLEEPEFRNVSISYEIEVPRDTRVDASSGSGAQTVRGVSGPVRASAGSGALTLSDIGGDVEARTGSGSIDANGVAGAFRAEAGSGSIRLEQTAAGDVSVSTGSGSSELGGIEGALRVRAGSGSITVNGRQGGPWELDAGSGSVRLDLPDDAAFELDAHARSGGIYTDHPVTVRNRLDESRLSGTVRGGGPLLRVRTGSGSIRIQ
jgi:hypothetical protein